MTNRDIDRPEWFVVTLIVEGDGEWLEWGRDVGEGIGRAEVPAWCIRDELFDTSAHDRGHQDGRQGSHDEHGCQGECRFVCGVHRIGLRDARLSGKIGILLA